MVVGGIGYDTRSTFGAVFVVSFTATGDYNLSNSHAVYTSDSLGDYAGFSVSGAGDQDGDGLDDVLIGVEGHGSDHGAAYVMFSTPSGGTESLSDADAIFEGEAPGDLLGNRQKCL